MMIKKIGLEYGRTKGATNLAQELGTSKQRVYQIVCQLRKSGVNIPKMNNKSLYQLAYKKAVKELKDKLKEI